MSEENTFIKISRELTIKDVITFISIAVAMTMAWGVFSTRLTVIEKELVYQTKEIEQLKKQQDQLKEKFEKMENRIRDNEDSLQTLWSKQIRQQGN